MIEHFTPDVYYLQDGRKVTRIPSKDLNTFYGRAKHLYHIRTKDNQIVTYQPNQGQKIIGDMIDTVTKLSMQTRGYPVFRGIILKPRQIGATTDTAVRIFDKMLLVKNYQALVTAHLGDDTDVIFDKYKIIYKNLSDFVEIVEEDGTIRELDETGRTLQHLKPQKESDSATQLRFENLTESWINIRTAGSGDRLGKGGSLNALHSTECANYTKYKDAVTSVSHQISDSSDAFVILESTANGITGDGEGFYKEWIRAESGYKRFTDGEIKYYAGYVPIFVPWYVIDEYQLPLYDQEMIDLSNIDFGGPDGKQKYLDKEQLLMDKYNVSKERINWFRFIIKTKCDYDINVANRYYPTFPEDAFLSTDKCFFDSNKLFELKKYFDSETLQLNYSVGYLDEELDFVKSTMGELTIVEEPDPDSVNRYIISLDSSKGVEDGDYTSMKVFDRVNEKFVAHWYGKLAEDLVAKEYVKLLIYYNYALAIPEINRATVVDLIKPEGMLEYEGPMYYNKINSDGTINVGFNTLVNTRKVMLDKYKAWLRDNYDKLNNLADVEEHIHFIRNVKKTGFVKYEAADGKKDDRVISCALAVYAHYWWDEDIGFLNDNKTDFKDIVVLNKKMNTVWGKRQSRLGNQKPQSTISKISVNKQSKIGKK